MWYDPNITFVAYDGKKYSGDEYAIHCRNFSTRHGWTDGKPDSTCDDGGCLSSVTVYNRENGKIVYSEDNYCEGGLSTKEYTYDENDLLDKEVYKQIRHAGEITDTWTSYYDDKERVTEVFVDYDDASDLSDYHEYYTYLEGTNAYSIWKDSNNNGVYDEGDEVTYHMPGAGKFSWDDEITKQEFNAIMGKRITAIMGHDPKIKPDENMSSIE